MRDVQSIISNYFADQDPRVRNAALKATVEQQNTFKFHPPPARKEPPLVATQQMTIIKHITHVLLQLQLHERGIKIDEIIYDQVID